MAAPPSSTVDAARTGDRAAFAVLYDAYARPLYWDLLARLRRREDAEDALHTAFLTAWRRLPELRSPERFGPWLFRIGRNAAADLRRGRGPAPSRPTHDGDRAAAEPDESAAPPWADAVRGLGEDTRLVLWLRIGLGWSPDEVARVLTTSVATVHRRQARGLEHLRRREQETFHAHA